MHSIMMTAVFGVIIVYIYAIVGYVYLSDSFAIDNIPMCTNLADCWVGALSEGLRGGDIGSFMVNVPSTDEHYAGLAAFTFVRLAVRSHTLLTRNASR